MTRAEIEALLDRGTSTDVLVRMRLTALLGHLQYAGGVEVVEVVSLPPVRRAVRVAITDVIAIADGTPAPSIDGTALATIAELVASVRRVLDHIEGDIADLQRRHGRPA